MRFYLFIGLVVFCQSNFAGSVTSGSIIADFEALANVTREARKSYLSAVFLAYQKEGLSRLDSAFGSGDSKNRLCEPGVFGEGKRISNVDLSPAKGCKQDLDLAANFFANTENAVHWQIFRTRLVLLCREAGAEYCGRLREIRLEKSKLQ